MYTATVERLTKREEEILRLLVEGLSNQEMADALNISKHTVKAHTESIYRKFNVHNKVQAAIYAALNGYIEMNEL